MGTDYKPKMYWISFPLACVLTVGFYFVYTGSPPGVGEIWLAVVAVFVVTPIIDWVLQKLRR